MPTASFVGLPADGVGKKMDNVHLTNPNTVEVEREVVVQGDPDVWAAQTKVTNAMPAPGTYGTSVRDVAPEYDSGLVELPTTLGVLTADTVRMHGVLLCNKTASVKKITITNTAATEYYMKDFPLQGGSTVYMSFGRVAAAGIKWNSDVAGVSAQLNGEK